MPDEWESSRGLNPEDPSDGPGDRDGDLYTNLEEYLNGLVPASIPPIEIETGYKIPSKGYCDQPYVVKTRDRAWLCVMTTGAGREGATGQHIVSTRSLDMGKTWSPLVDIESAEGPEASWAMPFITPNGRIYVFYTYNADNLREVLANTDYARRRVDTLGQYVFKFSDDGGLSWSSERWFIPVRETEIDRRNPYRGKVRFFWGVGKPILHQGAMILGFSKVGRFGQGFIEESEGWFLRCDNILTENDPAKLRWETLPEGEVGLRSPVGPIAEEANLTSLSDGSLFCTYRTVAGHPCHAYSRDGGRTWTPPAFMTYAPEGPPVDHPRAANFVRKLADGPSAGRFLYWFHNHSGRGYEGRNPAYFLGGIEQDSPAGKVIRWGRPVPILYSRDPKTRMSYPDFIEEGGRLFITETQKETARVHEVPPLLLAELWKGM
ncbi:MAG: exo-alpha-sialidase [Candidatus Omnitrophica bacterium]|nr:exo-alpha-sialidase [Candidatus Omnitrophota bacterium]